MAAPQMVLAIQIANGYGSQPGAWRMPGVDPSSYTDMDAIVRYARAAERGKIQLVFLADTPALTADLERETPQHAIDPLVVLTSMARGTERIGLAMDVYHDGIDAFVDQVIPVLQERGVFHHDYEGTTLREHLRAPAQYGLDPRLAETADATS